MYITAVFTIGLKNIILLLKFDNQITILGFKILYKDVDEHRSILACEVMSFRRSLLSLFLLYLYQSPTV